MVEVEVLPAVVVRVEFGVSMANSRAFWAHAGPERAVIIREARIGCLWLPALLTELLPAVVMEPVRGGLRHKNKS